MNEQCLSGLASVDRAMALRLLEESQPVLWRTKVAQDPEWRVYVGQTQRQFTE